MRPNDPEIEIVFSLTHARHCAGFDHHQFDRALNHMIDKGLVLEWNRSTGVSDIEHFRLLLRDTPETRGFADALTAQLGSYLSLSYRNVVDRTALDMIQAITNSKAAQSISQLGAKTVPDDSTLYLSDQVTIVLPELGG